MLQKYKLELLTQIQIFREIKQSPWNPKIQGKNLDKSPTRFHFPIPSCSVHRASIDTNSYLQRNLTKKGPQNPEIRKILCKSLTRFSPLPPCSVHRVHYETMPNNAASSPDNQNTTSTQWLPLLIRSNPNPGSLPSQVKVMIMRTRNCSHPDTLNFTSLRPRPGAAASHARYTLTLSVSDTIPWL